jgi:hypothetical protein
MKHEWVGPDKVIRWVYCKVCLLLARVSQPDKPGNADSECKGPGRLRPMEPSQPVGKSENQP